MSEELSNKGTPAKASPVNEGCMGPNLTVEEQEGKAPQKDEEKKTTTASATTAVEGVGEVVNGEGKDKQVKEKQQKQGPGFLITFLSSSVGKVVKRYLTNFYGCVSEYKKDQRVDICKHFRIIYPTDRTVENSYLGVENASSLGMQEHFWEKTLDYPH